MDRSGNLVLLQIVKFLSMDMCIGTVLSTAISFGNVGHPVPFLPECDFGAFDHASGGR